MIDRLVISDFLDAATRDEIVAELKTPGGDPALVYGERETGVVDQRVRRATRVTVSSKVRARVRQGLRERQRQIGEHFSVVLSECEEPQFLRYEIGDFFVAHQDGNTPLIFDESRYRRISVVVFLNAQSTEPASDTYGGGALVMYDSDYSGRLAVAAEPGTLVAFRAELTHEVAPVTHGERYSIVSWYR